MKKFNLEKFNDIYCKKMSPSVFDGVTLLVSLCIFALAHDLKLDMLARVSSSIAFAELMFCACWFICLCVYAFLKHRKDKNNKTTEEKKEVNDENI